MVYTLYSKITATFNGSRFIVNIQNIIIFVESDYGDTNKMQEAILSFENEG